MRVAMSNIRTKPEGRDAFFGKNIPEEFAPDSYKIKRKLREQTLCPGCGAVFSGGRWQWREAEAAHESLCPACHRQRDNFPAGFILLSGEYVAAHEQEISRIVLMHEEREKVEYPLRRVMNIEKLDDGVMVTTTDVNLARNIGEELLHTLSGKLYLNYERQPNRLQIRWQR